MDKQLDKELISITREWDFTLCALGFIAGVIGSLLVQAVLL